MLLARTSNFIRLQITSDDTDDGDDDHLSWDDNPRAYSYDSLISCVN